ncbi:glycosyltransferase family A protein [Occallatibacter riparius]|uniref:Glycosyltransferase family 2 protein n=1 Tax=Occallatibacter riparius TaxID=1002689 RepID=A0A9J7BIR0_9BACT|nr:glycosyltransferase family A protein [Occallatibacter riparius]UWZ81682.1 glycosyltransferase family 2 protein [Occallatibacter riparius]
MIIPALICALGLPAGYLLIRRVPTCPSSVSATGPSLSIIIPARNEERNLPRILRSIAESGAHPEQVLVIDDGSNDQTAPLGAALGARVVTSSAKPAGWTGKSWACLQGAQLASGDLLLFLDADTYFLPGGLGRIKSCWLRQRDPQLVLSILPFHATHAPYEQMSLVFNILMAAGAGGFGPLAAPQLFGQCLLIPRDLYFQAGGHAAVPGVVLENLRWAGNLRTCGARIQCLGGEGALHMRMFPEGFQQMSESWAKAFTQGAVDSGPIVLATSIIGISALWSTTLLFLVPHGQGLLALLIVYLLLGLQIAWMARRLGAYRFLTCFLFPVPLAYFCLVFGRATARRALGRTTTWRGREV